jgi:protein-S-isoprenylcysteine O-methyltransferase Ste14
MYTGILMLGPSLGLALGTWLLPVAATAMFLLLARRTRIEEKYPIARFGDRYRAYMARVGRFFPRWRRFGPALRVSQGRGSES